MVGNVNREAKSTTIIYGLHGDENTNNPDIFILVLSICSLKTAADINFDIFFMDLDIYFKPVNFPVSFQINVIVIIKKL